MIDVREHFRSWLLILALPLFLFACSSPTGFDGSDDERGGIDHPEVEEPAT